MLFWGLVTFLSRARVCALPLSLLLFLSICLDLFFFLRACAHVRSLSRSLSLARAISRALSFSLSLFFSLFSRNSATESEKKSEREKGNQEISWKKEKRKTFSP